MKFALVTTAAAALLAMPISAGAVNDASFNEMLGTMAARDTGSQQFDRYVAQLNQELEYKQGSEAYGAAGPNGPLEGFNGYVAGFRAPDTGSSWFDSYVDAVNAVIQTKQAYE